MDATPGEIELAMADIVAIPISRPCAHVSGALEEKRMGQTPTRLGTCLFSQSVLQNLYLTKTKRSSTHYPLSPLASQSVCTAEAQQGFRRALEAPLSWISAWGSSPCEHLRRGASRRATAAFERSAHNHMRGAQGGRRKPRRAPHRLAGGATAP